MVAVETVLAYAHTWGYWVAFGVALAESLAFVGIIVPGTVLLVAIGMLLGSGVGHIGIAIAFVALGAFVGDVISYYLGRHATRLFRREGFLRSYYFMRAQAFFARFGGVSVFLGRFIGPVRPVIPFVAGFVRMSRARFLFWNGVSAVLYAAVFLLIGYFSAQALYLLSMWSSRDTLLVIFLLAILGGTIILYRVAVRRSRAALSIARSIMRSVRHAIVANADVQRIVRRHPRVWRAIAARFDRTRFTGLPLTLAACAAVLLGIMGANTISGVVRTEAIATVDTRIEQLVAMLRTQSGTVFFWWVTHLGASVVIGIAAVVAVIVLWLHRLWVYIVPFGIALIGAVMTTAFGKIFFARPRPELAVYAEHSLSFPSGHATNAMIFYGFVAYILIRTTRRYTWRVAIFFSAASIIGMVALSRVYLGVHYISDVWAGILVGALWLVIGASVASWYRMHYTGAWRLRIARRVRIGGTVLAISTAVAAYIWYGVAHPVPRISMHGVTYGDTVRVAAPLDIFVREQLRYSETPQGTRQAPMSFLLLARSDDELVRAFRRAGWVGADAVTVASLWRTLRAAVFKESYPTAPMTPSFWNGRVHMFGFQKETQARNVRERHHARFWRTRYVMADGLRIYIGKASLDVGIKWGVTHTIDPAIDIEREVIFQDLMRAGVVAQWSKVSSTQPQMGRNFSGDTFFTDGMLYIITLRTTGDVIQ